MAQRKALLSNSVMTIDDAHTRSPKDTFLLPIRYLYTFSQVLVYGPLSNERCTYMEVVAVVVLKPAMLGVPDGRSRRTKWQCSSPDGGRFLHYTAGEGRL